MTREWVVWYEHIYTYIHTYIRTNKQAGMDVGAGMAGRLADVVFSAPHFDDANPIRAGLLVRSWITVYPASYGMVSSGVVWYGAIKKQAILTHL